MIVKTPRQKLDVPLHLAVHAITVPMLIDLEKIEYAPGFPKHVHNRILAKKSHEPGTCVTLHLLEGS